MEKDFIARSAIAPGARGSVQKYFQNKKIIIIVEKNQMVEGSM
jgi:hypothetical protein